MKPLYTDDEFQKSKSRQLLPLLCLNCNETFYRTKHEIQIALWLQEKRGRKRTWDFCSIQCHNRQNITSKTVECLQCLKPFIKQINQLKKTKHNFCCKSCAAKYGNAHKTKGTRVSKLEVWLSKQLPTLYPSIEFHFNRKDAINGELDIFIPSLKLAFELNGIFHYEPIYGLEKLNSIQTNDHRKAQACFEQDIELCIIDTSSLKYHKEQRALKFLAIIQNILNARLSGSSPVSEESVSSQHHVEVP